MQGVSVILIYNAAGDKMLLCKRAKDPYQGLLDFVGGKREAGESGEGCAYRELFEETGITPEDVRLTHIMDFTYHTTRWRVQVFAGQLWREVALVEEVNPLLWVDLNGDFFDGATYAGEGYIGHILAHMRKNAWRL